ncbi:MAG: undecaprenyl-diphosphate phosphatase [Oscillospiraceae bacterium]|nr:undecaprenyl-diphosphate phosphatase [Oscillospiraceae bacterium]
MFIFEIFKAVLFGIVEGITEWLPVSSTGHIILLDEFIRLNASEEFKSMFDVVIQLGAILAVIVIFFNKLNPFDAKKSPAKKKATWELWFKVCLAIVPSGIVGVLFDDWMDAHLHHGIPVAIALIVYGVAFILVEKRNAGVKPRIGKVWDIDYKTALLIGAFQCLSLVPGTSRSGSTILGAILLGVSRSAGSEFSFFMAIPTMLGASAIKLLKFLLSGAAFGFGEFVLLLVGTVVSFVVSMAAIKALMNYVRKHSFAAFGVYRIALGAVVLVYFVIKGIFA